MGIQSNYTKWSLGTQIQVIFSLSSFLICSVLIIIAYFQLDWLHSSMVSGSTTSLKSNLLSQMKALGRTESLYFAQEFNNYISLVQLLKNLNEISLGNSKSQSPVILSDLTPIRSYSVTKNSIINNRTAYSSRYSTISSLGYWTINCVTSLDHIKPFLYSDTFLSINEGFFIDEISIYYPSYYFDDFFTPIVREWYYKAVASPNDVIITEPYQDATTLAWTITVSQAIVNATGGAIGVSSLDITLDTLTEKIKEIVILETGFAMLVSAEGMVLTIPKRWQTKTSLRIYDEEVTAISEDFWGIMKSSLDMNIDYNDINGTEYSVVVESVQPIDNLTTHYILLFGNKSDFQIPISKLNESYERVYEIIFWIILTISVSVLITTLLLIYSYSKSVTRQFQLIQKIFIKIIRRALFVNIVRDVSFTKINRHSKGIETIVKSIKRYIRLISKHEEASTFINWGPTRPKEKYSARNWENSVYPFNLLNENKLRCQEAINTMTVLNTGDFELDNTNH